MKNLTRAALLTSALLLSACGESEQHAHNAETATGEFKGAGFHDGTHGHPVGTQADIDALNAEYHAAMPSEKEEKVDNDSNAATFTGSGFHDGTHGHPVGTQADIDALNAEYHEKMQAN
ncbi:MAG TPA: hypothetical protein DCR13_05370 [Gammaproteobacteria bacterium]|nr:hypothetical protein [Gammaproteobacteria bacterium]HAU06327.1 hypothetical protein [Gammaproteobacteria bacterium]